MSSQNLPTRTRILKATWELLDSNPGVAARMSDIAKKAGVSRQALYLHFPNRTELFIATTKYQDEVFGIQDGLAETRSAKSGTDRLRRYIEAWANHIPKIFGVAKTLMVMKETDADAATAWADRMQDMREGCAAAITALDAEDLLKPELDPDSATDILWTLLSISNWEQLTVTCGWPQPRYIERISAIAIQSLTLNEA
ncbi:DNA-binding transcriptional repressor AcrR [Roseovarius litorisediminis]|uniref:DNA-binding transcriptional repressor AcrR n=1 Tax=Roseovarius litorisediminis TaxID=1312363 RepID=A0A1Y5SGF2_9RHOB|nr:TetR/AcrR family transcriptional regulator [Roseovarius litorisediminis]SLN40243.1 DNA-binding transcriptional repressor AcrR [Roseovarius litorisediminis]